MPRYKEKLDMLRTLAIQIIICLLLLEVACQGYFYLISSQFDATRHSDQFYYQASTNPVLAYELASGKQLPLANRQLTINSFGIREVSNEKFRDKKRLGILGDSVVFGTGLSQDQTLPARLQARLDPKGVSLKVLNMGIPGYGLGEMPAWLQRVVGIYLPSDIIYVLNMNDFARRDSVYEGADNGLYRMFRRPLMMLPLFVRKAIYRLYKGDGLISVGWYRWLYEGNRDWGFRQIDIMDRWARSIGSTFTVAILPAGIALHPEGYALEEQESEINRHLKASGIRTIELRHYLTADCFDDTDHLNVHGADVAASALAAQIDLR